jgi:hypothetical protein
MMANQNDKNKKRQEEQDRMNRERDVDKKGGESSQDMDDLGNMEEDTEQ